MGCYIVSLLDTQKIKNNKIAELNEQLNLSQISTNIDSTISSDSVFAIDKNNIAYNIEDYIEN